MVGACHQVPLALVVGCGKACEIAEKEYRENSQKCKSLKVILEELLKKSNVNYHYNGAQQYCIDSSVNICFKGVMSEATLPLRWLCQLPLCGLAAQKHLALQAVPVQQVLSVKLSLSTVI